LNAELLTADELLAAPSALKTHVDALKAQRSAVEGSGDHAPMDESKDGESGAEDLSMAPAGELANCSFKSDIDDARQQMEQLKIATQAAESEPQQRLAAMTERSKPAVESAAVDDPSFAPLVVPNDLSEQTVSIRCQQSALAGNNSQFDLGVNTRVARVKEALKKQDTVGEVSLLTFAREPFRNESHDTSVTDQTHARLLCVALCAEAINSSSSQSQSG